MVDCVEGISAENIPDLLPSLQSSTEGKFRNIRMMMQQNLIYIMYMCYLNRIIRFGVRIAEKCKPTVAAPGKESAETS